MENVKAIHDEFDEMTLNLAHACRDQSSRFNEFEDSKVYRDVLEPIFRQSNTISNTIERLRITIKELQDIGII